MTPTPWLLSTTRLKDLDPEAVYDKDTDRFSLLLRASVKNPIDIGIGGFVTSSTNSMLFLSLGYNSLSHKAINASINGWIGQSYMAGMLDTRLMLRRRHVSALGLETVVWRQKFYENDKLFYQSDAPAFITNLESFVRLKYSRATNRQSIFSAGIAYGHTDDRFYNNDESIVNSETDRNKTIRDMGQASVRWIYSTLDDNLLPSKAGISACSDRAYGNGINSVRECPCHARSHPPRADTTNGSSLK